MNAKLLVQNVVWKFAPELERVEAFVRIIRIVMEQDVTIVSITIAAVFVEERVIMIVIADKLQRAIVNFASIVYVELVGVGLMRIAKWMRIVLNKETARHV